MYVWAYWLPELINELLSLIDMQIILSHYWQLSYALLQYMNTSTSDI